MFGYFGTNSPSVDGNIGLKVAFGLGSPNPPAEIEQELIS